MRYAHRLTVVPQARFALQAFHLTKIRVGPSCSTLVSPIWYMPKRQNRTLTKISNRPISHEPFLVFLISRISVVVLTRIGMTNSLDAVRG
jgi:hypothetical protein